MRNHHSKLIAATGAVTAAAAIAITGAAAASAAPHPVRPAASGTEHIQLMSTSATSKTSSAIATGVFTAGGTDTRTTSSTDTATFPNGTFVITHHKSSGTQHFNPTTCLFTLTQKGTYTLGSGTGAYAKLSGSGTYQLNILAVAAKAGGKCANPQTTPPAAFQQVIRASGPVSLP